MLPSHPPPFWYTPNPPCTQIRSQISQEFVQDLQAIAEENSILLRETLAVSLSLDATAEHPLESDLEMTSDEDVL